MSDRGRFSGFCWHDEYHSINRKKDKAADCVYQTEDRICTNRECLFNGEKCFVATHCRHRVREKELEEDSHCNAHILHIVKIGCSLPQGAILYNGTYGKGTFISYDKKFRIISVRFGSEVKKFRYPEAFMEGNLCASGEVYQKVNRDMKLAIWD